MSSSGQIIQKYKIQIQENTLTNIGSSLYLPWFLHQLHTTCTSCGNKRSHPRMEIPKRIVACLYIYERDLFFATKLDNQPARPESFRSCSFSKRPPLFHQPVHLRIFCFRDEKIERFPEMSAKTAIQERNFIMVSVSSRFNDA